MRRLHRILLGVACCWLFVEPRCSVGYWDGMGGAFEVYGILDMVSQVDPHGVQSVNTA
jgi:hypothetical protein